MIAQADKIENGDAFDFIAIIRSVCDARHISPKEVLSTVSRHFEDSAYWCRNIEVLDFDVYGGWSWREVLVWLSDASRVADKREEQEESARWRQQADQNWNAVLANR